MPVGKSIMEHLWEELVSDIKALKEGLKEGEPETQQAWLKGHAAALAWALAVMINPYAPNVRAVRKEAMRRYYESW